MQTKQNTTLKTQIQPKIHVLLKGGINFNSFDPFSEELNFLDTSEIF